MHNQLVRFRSATGIGGLFCFANLIRVRQVTNDNIWRICAYFGELTYIIGFTNCSICIMKKIYVATYGNQEFVLPDF